MREMRRAARQEDVPFSVFLDGSKQPQPAKRISASFVEGFNAARKEIVGIGSLAIDAEASDAIDGDRSFRFFSGYDSICLALLGAIPDYQKSLRLSSVVESVHWQPGAVSVRCRSAIDYSSQLVHCSRVVITVPLGVLHAGADEPGTIHFDPEPAESLAAARSLEFGQVFRIVFRFREHFWEAREDFADAGFILSDEQLFPTWWTTLAVRAPILTGWSAGPHADALEGKSAAETAAAALRSLSHITGTSAERLTDLTAAVYFHDWHADPFSRGAYSYVPAGALQARKKLAEPVEDTLFFSGEATELNGHSATVHGAIASGIRAAQQIISTIESSRCE
jgi:monoamine oxidase